MELFFPPPLFISAGKNAITFFLLFRYVRKKFWWDKSIHFVCFPNFFLSLSVSHDFTPILPKIGPFLPKIAYFGGKQTKSNFFFKNEKFEPRRCLWTSQVLQKHQNSWFYVFPKLGHGHAKFRKMKKISFFKGIPLKKWKNRKNLHFSKFGLTMT